MCLQVPRVLDLKSGQVQALSPTSNPWTVTVYCPPDSGLVDPVVGEDPLLAEVLDVELAGLGPLPADVDLFLAEHLSCLVRPA